LIIFPELILEKDSDQYFKVLVTRWCNRKKGKNLPFKHKRIIISSGPKRLSAVRLQSLSNKTLHIDFYSALRSGFGYLSEDEVTNIIKNWL
jgi:hypothetical protein